MTAEMLKPATGVVKEHAHYFPLRVYIEDTDLGGVVYYANYLRFLERARSDFLRTVGINQRDAIEGRKGVYAVVEVNIKYLKPAKLDDSLLVVSSVEETRSVSCLLSQRIMRDQELLTDATIKVAFLGPDGRPKRQPQEWLQKFNRIQKERA